MLSFSSPFPFSFFSFFLFPFHVRCIQTNILAFFCTSPFLLLSVPVSYLSILLALFVSLPLLFLLFTPLLPIHLSFVINRERYTELSTSEADVWTFWPLCSFHLIWSSQLQFGSAKTFLFASLFLIHEGETLFIPFRPLAVHKEMRRFYLTKPFFFIFRNSIRGYIYRAKHFAHCDSLRGNAINAAQVRCLLFGKYSSRWTARGQSTVGHGPWIMDSGRQMRDDAAIDHNWCGHPSRPIFFFHYPFILLTLFLPRFNLEGRKAKRMNQI